MIADLLGLLILAAVLCALGVFAEWCAIASIQRDEAYRKHEQTKGGNP